MHHPLSPLAAWKTHQCTSAWRHQLKPKHRNMFIRNQRGVSMCWNSIWLKYGHQPAGVHWSIDRSVARLFYCVSQRQKQTLWTFAVMCFSTICNCHHFESIHYYCYEKIYLCFVSQGRVRTVVRRGGQFCCKFTKVFVCQKLLKYCEVWQSYYKNNKGAIFLLHSIVLLLNKLVKAFCGSICLVVSEVAATRPPFRDDDSASVATVLENYDAAKHTPVFYGNFMHKRVSVDEPPEADFDASRSHPASVGFAFVPRPPPEKPKSPPPPPDGRSCEYVMWHDYINY